MTKSQLAAIFALALGILPWRAAAAGLTAGPGSVLSVDGTSTLHPWEAKTQNVAVDMSLDQAAGESLEAAVKAAKPAKLTVTVHVADLKSEHSGMDKNLRKTMNADKNPDVVFVLDSYKALLDKEGEQIVAPGKLTIDGQTKDVTLKAKAANEDGKLVVDGEQPVVMSDFGIKPPSLMLGALKVADQVVVKFHLVLEPAADNAKGK